MSEELRLCPKLLIREERKAIAIGTGDIVVSYFQPCLKERCMAYSGRHCDEYPVSGSTYYDPQESDHKCHTCKHYTSGENDGSCGSYICKHYSNWESEGTEVSDGIEI